MKNPIASTVITGYVWLVLFVTIIPFFIIYLIIWIITSPFDRKLIYCHYFVGIWAGFYILINPWWKVTIENRFKMEKDQTYIILSNHQSLLDSLAIYRLHFPFRWIIKQELFRIPVVGWVLFLNKYIPVIRGDKDSKDKMISRAIGALKKGISILIFPEGTRSTDGNMGEFREGAFIIALESKSIMLPVIIDGAYHALPKNDFLFRRKQHIVVKVLDPVKPEDYDSLPLPLMIKKMEMLMAEELVKLRNENIILHHE
jgi:1-acyl-sn-glycerol-3-phosphate acyltransferase